MERDRIGLSGPLNPERLSAWTCTLAGRCDNQAIGGIRDIKWERGEASWHSRCSVFLIHNSTILLLQRNGRAGNGGEGKQAQWGGGGESFLLLYRIWCVELRAPPHLGARHGPSATPPMFPSACTGLVLRLLDFTSRTWFCMCGPHSICISSSIGRPVHPPDPARSRGLRTGSHLVQVPPPAEDDQGE
jgi:hypothetical protein